MAPNTAPRADRPSTGGSEANGETVAGRVVRRFESWAEFVDQAKINACGRGGRYSHNADIPNYGGGMFFETKSFEEAENLARHGWNEIRPEIDALVDKIDSVVAPTLQPAFTNYFDVSGDSVDIGRFMDGEPECMLETKLAHIAKPGRVVSILVDGFYSASNRAEDIRARGVAIVALIDALEKMQHSAEVWLETSFRDSKLTYLVNLRRADQALNIDTLMFAIAHPSAYRRIGFAMQESEPREFKVGDGHSYGRPAGLKMGDVVNASIKLDRLVHGADIEFGPVWVEKVLSDFGMIVGEE